MKVLDFKGLVQTANGKVCEHSNISVACNRRTGRCHSVTRHPENYKVGPASQLQQQVRDLVKDRSAVLSVVLKAAKSDSDLMKALVTKRDTEALYSISVAAMKLYDKDDKSITIGGKKYTAADADSTGTSGSDTPPIV